ncbi:MAG: FAD-dependent protein, partial [Actinomycetota bacterium]
GWGGAGAFSDGKLNLSTEIGGWLNQYIPRQELSDLIDYVDQIYLDFGAPKESYEADERILRRLKRKAVSADLILVPTRIRHLGTDICGKVLRNIREYFDGKVEVKANTNVKYILTEDRTAVGVETDKGQKIWAKYVIVAPGREGAEWLTCEAQRLKLTLQANAVDLGVRLEVPAAVMEPLTKELYEPKLIYYSRSFEDQVRLFCACPHGVVSRETYGDVITVNGHSYRDARTENTNFALLVSTTFTEPFHEPIAYGKYIARLANLLGEGIIIQRLGDLQAGRRSTESRIRKSTVKPTLSEATPGDLSFVLPYRCLADILEMIEVLDRVVPGVNSKNTLLYGVEVKFYSSRVKLKSTLETEIKNFYAIGDGAGITRGLVQSSASGIIAARSILNKVRK